MVSMDSSNPGSVTTENLRDNLKHEYKRAAKEAAATAVQVGVGAGAVTLGPALVPAATAFATKVSSETIVLASALGATGSRLMQRAAVSLQQGLNTTTRIIQQGSGSLQSGLYQANQAAPKLSDYSFRVGVAHGLISEASESIIDTTGISGTNFESTPLGPIESSFSAGEAAGQTAAFVVKEATEYFGHVQDSIENGSLFEENDEE